MDKFLFKLTLAIGLTMIFTFIAHAVLDFDSLMATVTQTWSHTLLTIFVLGTSIAVSIVAYRDLRKM